MTSRVLKVVLALLALGMLAMAVAIFSQSAALRSSNAALASSQATVKAVVGKSKEQTKAEQQLRAIVASQQQTIRTFTSAAFVAVAKGQRELIANFDALDFVIIDAISGNRTALQRDLRLLEQLLQTP